MATTQNNLDHSTEDADHVFNSTSTGVITQTFPGVEYVKYNTTEDDRPINCTCIPDSTHPNTLGRFIKNGVPFKWFVCAVIVAIILSIFSVFLTFLLIRNNKSNDEYEKKEQDNETGLQEMKTATNNDGPYETYVPAEIELYSDDPNSPYYFGFE